VQRGLAAKLQGLSASFRKKQRVYLESAFTSFCNLRQRLISGNASFLSRSPIGLQGHAIKNQDLLIASGSLSLKGQEGLSAVDDDLQAAVRASFDQLSLSFADRMLKNITDLIPRFSPNSKLRIISNRI
jgi:syntaxin 16